MADLYLHDSEFDVSEEKMLAMGMFGIMSAPASVDDWKGLAAAILQQAQIGHLVLSFHSFDGGMIVGGEGKQLGEPAVKALFSRAGGKPPRVETITFFGCNVGNRPTQMVAFAEMFGAKTVSGYTWWIIRQPVSINFPKGTDEATAKKTLAPFAEYAVGALPAANILANVHTSRKDHEVKFLACYASPDGSTATTLPIPAGEKRTRKPWRDAGKKKITAKEAAAAEKAYQSSPVVAFELVTVTL